MSYYIAKFFRYIPTIDGMRVVTSFDNFNVVEFTTDTAYAAVSSMEAFPFQGVKKYIPLVEITQYELSACKHYGETRPYRKAYSDVEGLPSDPDELAKGKRKTKVYLNNANFAAVSADAVDLTPHLVSLMKKSLKLHLEQEMEDRKLGLPNTDTLYPRPDYDADTHARIHTLIDSLSTIDDLHYEREMTFGIEMPKDLAVRRGHWNDTRNARLSAVKFGYQF